MSSDLEYLIKPPWKDAIKSNPSEILSLITKTTYVYQDNYTFWSQRPYHFCQCCINFGVFFFLTQNSCSNVSCFHLLLIINPLCIKARKRSTHRLLKIILCIQRPATVTGATEIDQRVTFQCTLSKYRKNAEECSHHLGI